MEKITIKIHSFIDIITNSSTEIFVKASNNTIKSIKELVNSLLAIAKSEMKFDDIFTIELGEEEETYHEYYSERSVIVKAIDENKESKLASGILSNLTGLFEINADYNG